MNCDRDYIHQQWKIKKIRDVSLKLPWKRPATPVLPKRRKPPRRAGGARGQKNTLGLRGSTQGTVWGPVTKQGTETGGRPTRCCWSWSGPPPGGSHVLHQWAPARSSAEGPTVGRTSPGNHPAKHRDSDNTDKPFLCCFLLGPHHQPNLLLLLLLEDQPTSDSPW